RERRRGCEQPVEGSDRDRVRTVRADDDEAAALRAMQDGQASGFRVGGGKGECGDVRHGESASKQETVFETRIATLHLRVNSSTLIGNAERHGEANQGDAALQGSRQACTAG